MTTLKLISLLTTLALIAMYVSVFRGGRALERERFERSNQAGVLEFTDFNESRRFNRRVYWHDLKSNLLLPLFVFNVPFVLFVWMA